MSTQLFKAKDMKSAINLVNEEFGENAIIMSTKKSNGFVEVEASNNNNVIESHKKKIQEKNAFSKVFFKNLNQNVHFDDIKKLLGVLHTLVNQGNTVVVIEHNLDVIKTADWIIDIGPNGGNLGGSIVTEGTPEDIINVKESQTGFYLKLLTERQSKAFSKAI